MELTKAADHELLDAEWVSLILDARTRGLSIEEIRSALAELQATSMFVRRFAKE